MTAVSAVVLALALAALPALPSWASGSGEKALKGRRIVMVLPADRASWSDEARAGIAAFQKEHSEVTATTAFVRDGGTASDAEAPAKLVDDLTAEGAAAIITAPPADSSPLAAALARASAAGVVVVTLGAPDVARANLDIEPWDDSGFGRHLVDAMAAWMGYAGEWVPVVDRADSGRESRLLEGAAAEARAAYPGLAVAADRLECQGSRQAAHDRVVEALKAHPGLKAILCSSAAAVQGAARAVSELDLIGKVGVFGNCLPSEAGDSIRSGAVVSLHFWAPDDAAYVAARAAYGLLGGSRLGALVDLGTDGYERMPVRPNASKVPVAYGRAWVDVTKDSLKDWIRPDGGFRL